MEYFRDVIEFLIAGIGLNMSAVIFAIAIVARNLFIEYILHLSGLYPPIMTELYGILQTSVKKLILTGYNLHSLLKYGFDTPSLTFYSSVFGMVLLGIAGLDERTNQIRTLSKAVYIGIITFGAIIGWAIVLQSLVKMMGYTVGPLGIQLLNTLSLGLGGVTITGWYLYISENSLSYLDISMPMTPREIGYIIGGIIGLFGLLKGTEFLLTYFTIPIAEHGIATQARQGNPAVLLVLIPAAWLIIGPIEEILYRNIIQKLLYSAFSRWQAIGLASIIFALSHIPAYVGSGLLALTSTIILLLVLSTILGIVYERTQNIITSAIVHGSYDGILFIMLYFRLT
ncbi:MAG: lysostaphin resistance A-like protein [Halobacteriaceae archaeon]